MILPLGLAYTLTSRMKALTKILTGYASLVIVAGLVVTVSRGGWFAAASALLIFFMVLLFHHTYRLPALALLAVIIVGGAYFGPRDVFFMGRIKALSAEKNGPTGDSRYAIWQSRRGSVARKSVVGHWSCAF